jgi:hypothetical protein
MLHPDTLLLKRVVFLKETKKRRGNASPAGATLGAEPKLFFPKVAFSRLRLSGAPGLSLDGFPLKSWYESLKSYPESI